MLLPRQELSRDKDIDLLVAESDGRVNPQQKFERLGALRPHTGLLREFAEGAEHARLFGAVHLAGRQLQGKAVQRVPVLPHHQDAPVREHRHHGGGAVVVNKVPAFFSAVCDHQVAVHL